MKTLDQQSHTTTAPTTEQTQRARWLLYGEITLGVGALILMPIAI